MWSDECLVEWGQGYTIEWCFGTPVNKWNPEYVFIYKKGRDISVMVWACFWGFGRSDLFILDRDFEAKKHRYMAQSYLEALEDQLPHCWVPGLIFMQNNARIHTAKAVKDWFEEMGIPVTDWPPYPPDLNLIEHIWFHLKKKVLELHPELEFATGKSESDIEALEKALIEA